MQLLTFSMFTLSCLVARRKTIYEYHRVNFNSQDIRNNTVITLTALPTCLQLHDCDSCISTKTHTFTVSIQQSIPIIEGFEYDEYDDLIKQKYNYIQSLQCTWCPSLNRCSTGTDRKRQQWIQRGCDRSQISDATQCPAKGAKGNNYDEQQTVLPSAPGSSDNERWNHDAVDTPHTNSKESEVTIKQAQPLADPNTANSAHSGGVSFAAGVLFPCVLVMCLVLWMFYAYRNPHTKSGQLLIQVRI